MKESSFFAKLYRRGFWFETPDDSVMSCSTKVATIDVVINEEDIRVASLTFFGKPDSASFLGPNRHELALVYVDALKELLS